MTIKMGLEQELTLLTKEGMIANKADEVLFRLKNDPRFVKEAQEYCVEVNTPAASSTAELEHLLRDALLTLEAAAEQENVLVAPVCYFGYGPIKVRTSPRYQAYVPIIGKENDDLSNTITGIHLHLDQIPGKLVEQQRLLTALDPLAVAVTSSSPIDYQRRNGLNCQRTHLVKRVIFADANLRCASYYAENEEDIARHDEERYQHWGAKWAENTQRPLQEFKERFPNPQNTGYHSPRKRDNIGRGTWEVRIFDTTLLPYALAAAALHKGIHDRTIEENIPVKIAAKENEYFFSPDGIVLPTLTALQELTDEAIRKGARDPSVAAYLAQAISFAKEGLSPEDQKYLLPAEEMLKNGRMNFADKILARLAANFSSSARQSRQFHEGEIAAANYFVRNAYRDSLY